MKKITVVISLFFLVSFVWGEQIPEKNTTSGNPKKIINEKKYFVANQYGLRLEWDGLDGKLELLQDKAFKNWKNPGSRKEGNFQMSENYAKNFKPALLQLRNTEGRIVETKDLKSVWFNPIWITLGNEDLYGTGRTSYFVQQDNEIGSGSGQGTYCRYFDVVKGKIVWLKAKDNKTGKVHPIDLNSNMLYIWKSVPSPKGKGKILLQRWPDYPKHTTHYERYEFNGHEWIKYERVEKGSKDSEDTFPDISAFN